MIKIDNRLKLIEVVINLAITVDIYVFQIA